MKLGIGLVGLGRHGSRYAESLSKMGGKAELVAVCRRNLPEAERFAATWGAKKAYGDHKDLARDRDVDAVIVATPNSSHVEIAVEAAENGKHLLVEKPLGRTVREAEEIISSARRNGVKLTVGHSFRYHPMTLASIKFLGELGHVYLAAMCKRQPEVAGWRIDRRERGGAIMDLGVHLFDLTEFVLKKRPTAVYCQARQVLGSGVEDSFVAVLDLPGNAVAVLDASTISKSRTDRMEFAGTEGHLSADRYSREVCLAKGGSRISFPMTGPDATVRLLLDDFVDSIIEGKEPPITGEDGLEAVRVAEACYRSSETNSKVAT
ncbi:MAG: Gfo/Idh/MocA family oxidoreductase [Candidatus Brockarchaeota archaeon]|nr:Gfo/Idh/MocA family oxidoreductase [Candidatus Brockarchaeota archaeon]